MKDSESFLGLYRQNAKLSIRLTSPAFGRLPAEVLDSYGLTHRKPGYFLLFMLDGMSRHGVDLQHFDVRGNELLFILPNQIHQLPLSRGGLDYYKLSFDETCLSLLPKQLSFLINPLNNQKICLDPSGASRLKAIFGILRELLSEMDADAALVLVYLNCLLTEIDTAYFSTEKNPLGKKLSTFIDFKMFVENHFTDHPEVSYIAEKLTISISSLYGIVKHYSGISPKEFIINRLMLEARRRLYYTESSSIKELAYDLGFNDPEYFSRLFKKVTGKTIDAFSVDLSGN
jgi:AraC family transcriptional activator of pobA